MRQVPLTMIISIEALFVTSLVLFILARITTHFPVALAYFAAVLVPSVLPNVVFPGNWGDFGLLALCGFAIYRFPLRWSWPIAALSIVVLAETHGLNDFLLVRHISGNSQLVTMPHFCKALTFRAIKAASVLHSLGIATSRSKRSKSPRMPGCTQA
jgi:hypothetical protein